MDVAKRLTFDDLSATLTDSLAKLWASNASARQDGGKDFAAALTALAG